MTISSAKGIATLGVKATAVGTASSGSASAFMVHIARGGIKRISSTSLLVSKRDGPDKTLRLGENDCSLSIRAGPRRTICRMCCRARRSDSGNLVTGVANDVHVKSVSVCN